MNDLDSYRKGRIDLHSVITKIRDTPIEFINYREEMIAPTSINFQNAQETTTRLLDFWTSYNSESIQDYKKYLLEHGITNEKTIHSKLIEYAVILEGYYRWSNNKTLKTK